MAKTLAQKHADKQLEDAVTRMIEAYDMLDDDMTLVDYVVCIEALNLDEDGQTDHEAYAMGFRNGFARTTVALGIMDRCKDVLKSAERTE